MAPPISVTTPLAPGSLLLVDFSGREALSELFSFDLHLAAPLGTAVPFEQLIGQRFTISVALPGGGTRFLDGRCVRLAEGTRGKSFTFYRAEVVPQLWNLTRSRRNRIFQRISVPEILARVLKGMPLRFELGAYDARNYCVQYRETDFDFASRLMEEEGIYYFFTHSSGGHTMVVADSPESHPDVPAPASVAFAKKPPTGPDTATVMQWSKTQELRSGKVTLRDHHIELPSNTLEASATTPDAVQVGTVTHHLAVGGNSAFELYDYPGEYAERYDAVSSGGADQPGELQKLFADARRTAHLRMEQEALPALHVDGLSDCRQFTAGHRFALSGHFAGDGPYVLTNVQHDAALSGDPRTATEDQFEYHNTFGCIPVALPFRPVRKTPRPSVAGVQTAVVVGPPGEETFADKYGRVKVQFHWDREGKKDAASSCWVRVGALHAGQEGGFAVVPRIGQEVVVGFEEGDPDQPVIVGSVYDASHLPPAGASA
jgi:type VI secretion system secreted protein VgrG